ncbi:MAG: hydroxysqualene dehydroxylase HpnE [Bacteriovoracaceae bacterium]|nr:hydroxysqualene dehydroxylase HpnE [Bacteroidota bacterium]
MPVHSPDVLIIGGGLAGLSAAIELSHRGRSVMVVEQKQRLGGRTYSFLHTETGDEVDNGQHLMMGCYHATLRYLSTIEMLHQVEIQENLSIVFRHPDRTPSFLKTFPFPAPFNVLAGLLQLDHLSVPQRLSLLRVGLDLLLKNPDTSSYLQSITVKEWLDALGQSERNKRALWDIIAVGALNDSTDKISAALFVKVLKSAFFGNRMNASMVIPKAGLSTVLVDGAATYIKKKNGTILLNTSVDNVDINASRIDLVRLNNGETVQPRSVISAVPYFDIPKVFGSGEAIGLKGLDNFISSPIITLHLWFDAHFVKEKFVALIDSPIHWIFNKSAIYGREHQGLMYLSLVVSGAHAMAEMEKDDLVRIAQNELHRFYPAAPLAKVIHALIIKEKRATFSPVVGIEKIRPKPATIVSNLFLAGDWTDTKLPATIEGAVQSGYTSSFAAEKYLSFMRSI